MGDRINSATIEALIRAKVKEKGLSNDIDESKIIEIKDIVKKHLSKSKENLSKSKNDDDNMFLWFSGDPRSNNSLTEEVPNNPEVVVSNPTPVATSPEAITQTVSISKDAVDLAKKEGELEQKEKEISNREANIANKEAEFQRKQDELAYVPQIPAVLNNIGNEKLFIFNKNEISLGSEALANNKFRLMSNPDDKKSMIELWATEGKKGAELYLVNFEKLGEITFNPFEGTSKFEEKPIDDGQTPIDVPFDGLTPEEAQASQEPTESISDAIEPKTDVTLALSDDMGLKSSEIEIMLKNRLDDIIKSYFTEKFPKL